MRKLVLLLGGFSLLLVILFCSLRNRLPRGDGSDTANGTADVRAVSSGQSEPVRAAAPNVGSTTGLAAETGAAVEQRQIEVVRSVVEAVKVPVGVKLTAFYASVPSFVRRLEQAGARGVVVFNRFYQPDIDLDTLDVDRRLAPSTPADLPLRLHALALLSPTAKLSLACTGGVHSGLDAAKAILSGAHVVQLASVLLEHGAQHVSVVRDELARWLHEKGYRSSAEARGVLDLRSAPDPHAWERLNYARMLDGWRAREGWRKVP